MTKNADHYFKCMVGDEVRMFRDTSLEAIGLYVRLRNFSFDSVPIGFLVDHHHRPFDARRLADAVGEKNARFQALFSEIRQQRLVQAVPEFDAFLVHQAQRNRRAARKLALFHDVIGEVWPDGPILLDDVCLVPQLLDQRLESMYGQRTGRKGGNPDLAVAKDGEVVNQGGYPPTLTTLVNPQRSEVRGQRSEVRGQKEKEKESAANARAVLAPLGPPPWSWPKHLFECDQVRKWEATLGDDVKLDEQRYGSMFFGRFGYAFEVFRAATAYYEFGPQSPDIPQSCRDGHHVPEDGTGRCRYCREFLGRATA